MIRVEHSARPRDAGLPVEARLMREAFADTATLTAYRGARTVGVWTVPVDGDHVRRAARVLPYAAPALHEQHPQRRRDMMRALLAALQERYSSLELPLAPGFHDVAACRPLGIAVEWRHTNVLALDGDWQAGYSSTVRQHVRVAAAAAEVSVGTELAGFRFDRALVAQDPEAMALRTRFARQADAQGAVTCLTAHQESRAVGQLLVLSAGETAYCMHSWFDRSGPCGVPSLLIDSAAAAMRATGHRALDLEGSVLPEVDYFMTGFGGTVTPYPHLYWHRESDSMTALLLDGISAGVATVEEARVTA
jgi:hypothetical protein